MKLFPTFTRHHLITHTNFIRHNPGHNRLLVRLLRNCGFDILELDEIAFQGPVPEYPASRGYIFAV